MHNILVADADTQTASGIMIHIRDQGIAVTAAKNAAEALDAAVQREVQLLIADFSVMDSEEGKALARVRAEKEIPLILIVSRSEEIGRAMEIGADDYVLRPFSHAELAARVMFRLGRGGMGGETGRAGDDYIIRVGALVLDPIRREAEVDGRAVRLTPTEYRILELLCRNRGSVLSAKEIYLRVWNEKYAVGDNTVAVHIRHIREKIEPNPKKPKFIKSVWSAGYKVD